jgi:hypothetical protein
MKYEKEEQNREKEKKVAKIADQEIFHNYGQLGQMGGGGDKSYFFSRFFFVSYILSD